MAPNFPALAETLFQALCDEHNVTRNKAAHDRTGWDYLIEIDPPFGHTLLADQRPPSVSARVQIKSRSAGPRSAKVKLTNALRFAKEPQPCFLVLYYFSSSDLSPRIYARHFDNDLIENALRKARQADTEKRRALNQVEMTITFSERNDHTNDLMQWMLDICSVDPVEYSSQKRATERQAGYGGKLWSGTFQIEARDLPKLIEYAVGLEDHPPPVMASLHNWRFDIMSPVPIIEGIQDVTGYQVAAERGTILLKGKTSSAEFQGSIRHILINDDLQSAVFSSDDLIFTLRGLEAEFDLRVKQEDIRPLRRLREVLRYINVLDRSSKFQLWASGKKIMQCALPPHPISIQPQCDWALRCLNALVAIDRDNSDPELSPDSLFDEDMALDELLTWLSSPRVGLSRHMGGDFTLGKVVSQAAYFQARFGKSVYWAALRRPVLHEYSNRGVRNVVLGRATVMDSAVVSSTRLRSASLAKRFGSAVTLSGPGTFVIGDGNLVAEADAAWSITE